jgi:hypothetical protein
MSNMTKDRDRSTVPAARGIESKWSEREDQTGLKATILVDSVYGKSRSPGPTARLR